MIIDIKMIDIKDIEESLIEKFKQLIRILNDSILNNSIRKVGNEFKLLVFHYSYEVFTP